MAEAAMVARVIGVASHSEQQQRAGVFKQDLPRVQEDETNDLTPGIRRLLAELLEDLRVLEARIAEVTREIEALAQGG
jgi:transposase